MVRMRVDSEKENTKEGIAVLVLVQYKNIRDQYKLSIFIFIFI